MSEDEKLEAFLKELTELTRKHGFEVSACSCCDSPWVLETKNREGTYKTDKNGNLLSYV